MGGIPSCYRCGKVVSVAPMKIISHLNEDREEILEPIFFCPHCEISLKEENLYDKLVLLGNQMKDKLRFVEILRSIPKIKNI
ncbi:hypothetical protein WKT22_02179 [Candidatus Lokiarchaeum ossiferum]